MRPHWHLLKSSSVGQKEEHSLWCSVLTETRVMKITWIAGCYASSSECSNHFLRKTRGGSRIFLRGGWFSKTMATFFLGRPNWFSELSQTTIRTLIWPNFLRRSPIFEKRPKKAFLGTFWKISTKKFAPSRSPLKISIDWRQRRL